MQTIADACGVSRNAVSIAMRGGGKGVSAVTGARIRAKAEELGYVPDPELSRLARRLGSKKRKEGVRGEVAYLVPMLTGFTNGSERLFQEICEESVRRMGYHLESYFCGPNHATPAQLQRIWRNRGVQGILVFSPHDPVLKGEWAFDWDAFSWVAFSQGMTEPVLHRINWNFRATVETCYFKLKEKGYQRIGLVMQDSYDKRVGHAGIAATAVHYAHVPAKQRVARLRDSRIGDPAQRAELTQRWLDKVKPDAVIGSVDTKRCLLDLGLDIPGDLAFVNFRLQREEQGRVAGVMPGFDTLAKTSIELLISQMDHNVKGLPKHPLLTLVEGEWMEGLTAPVKRG